MIKKSIIVELFIVVIVIICGFVYRSQKTDVTPVDEEKKR